MPFFLRDANMDKADKINTYPDCNRCGHCCELNIIAITDDDLENMHAYVRENDIAPKDQNAQRCCFQNDDRTCMIWEARPQICRLHNCNVARIEILKRNPNIHVPDDIPLRNLHEQFVLAYNK